MPLDYVTLYQLRAELGIAADVTGDDALLRRYLRKGSEWIDQYCRRRFDVRKELRAQDYPVRPRSGFGRYPSHTAWMVAELSAVNDVSAGLLRLDDDLLEVLSVANGDGAALESDDYWFEPANGYPRHALRLRPSSGTSWKPGTSGNDRQCIPLTGVWGYHDRYGDAWPATLDTVQDAPLTSGATVMTVSDADGVAEDSDEPRFQVGNLARLGSGATFEYVLVRAVTAGATNQVTIKRAANGTTAQAWAQNTPIYVYRPMATICQALSRLATWAYRLKDATFFERISLLGTGYKVAPGAVPPDVLDMLPAPRPERPT